MKARQPSCRWLLVRGFYPPLYDRFLKQRLNDGQPSNLFFWRDSKGLEIDLKAWLALSGRPEHPAWLIYGGGRTLRRDRIGILPWSKIPGPAGDQGEGG